MAKDGGYILPAEIEPENSIYVCVAVPDEAEHRQAFAGAIHSLTRWWNWQQDEENSGRLVAAVWWDIYASVVSQLNDQLESCSEECDTVIYGIRTVGCELQVQYEEEGDWTPIGDFSECGATGPEGPEGETGPTGATGPEGPEGESPGDPDSEGGVPDPIAGPGVEDLKCAVATGVADKATDLLVEYLQQRQLQTIFAEVIFMAGALLISGPVGVVAAVIGGFYGLWTVQDAEDAEQELDQTWRDEARCRLYCTLGDDASVTRSVLDQWGADMEAYSENAGEKFGQMLDGTTVYSIRNEANLAALTDESCDDCECTWEQVWDFTSGGQQGWDIPDAGGSPRGYWQDGVGFVGDAEGSNWTLSISRNWAETELRNATMPMERTNGGGNNSNEMYILRDGPAIVHVDTSPDAGSYDYVWDGVCEGNTGLGIILTIVPGTGTLIISGLTLRGIGNNPFE